MQERRVLVTRCLDEDEKLLFEISSPALKAYAQKVGADFSVISGHALPATANEWAKLQLGVFLETYDRVLYIDPDCIVRDDTPDLFALVPQDMFGILDESVYLKKDFTLAQAACTLLGSREEVASYFNSGVMLVSKQHKELFGRPEDPMLGFRFDDYWSALLVARETAVGRLDYRFNRLPELDAATGEERFESYIIHYAGYPSAEALAPVMEEDIAMWKKSAGAYRYPRHYLISADGGLGDHVSAEPVIRFLKEHLDPMDDLRIAAHWPRVYEHLGVPVHQHNSFTPSAGVSYRTLWTLPNPNSAIGRSICSLLCHAVEHHSLTMLSRMLPLADREVRLPVSEEDKKKLRERLGQIDMRRVVAVHAGKSWQTKTFPLEWWQESVDALAARGLAVCLIGKSASHLEDDATGVVPVKAPEGGIDLRDKLELGELFALLEQAPVLLTNDSSPVQIAGAFDNWIVMIATVKPPDLVFPYRKGSPQYKTKALYKRLLVDDIPFDPVNPQGMQIDFEVTDWTPYLPRPEDVAAEVETLYKESV